LNIISEVKFTQTYSSSFPFELRARIKQFTKPYCIFAGLDDFALAVV
jgi:hypothetical protein